MSRNYKQGWYKLKNPQKFIHPVDEFMNSYKDGKVNYKSSLEQKAFKYQDTASQIIQWSIEPFQIQYLKPTTGKFHRYFIDMFIVTNQGKFLIEIKPKSQTLQPKKPKELTPRSIRRYNESLETFQINQAKWEAQKQFQERNGQEFIIFTEEQL